LIAPRSMLVRLMPGILLLVGFVPVHISLWDKFPIWYHCTFLLSLVPLTYLGGGITPLTLKPARDRAPSLARNG
jgi:hypothetical protein